MAGIDDYLEKAGALLASDLHITAGLPPMVRVDGQLRPLEGEAPLAREETQRLACSMLSPEQKAALESRGQVDFACSLAGQGRFRVNVFRQRHSVSAAIRLFGSGIPTVDRLGLPPVLKELAMRPRGLVLIAGPAGSGKSTTLAAMVDYINQNSRCHILTIEDPIEYLHRHKNCIVTQREVGDDTASFADALRSALREDPDVILVGEMRDLETVATAVSAAETGHLVLSTLHTVGAAQTVDRIIGMFPPHQQQQIRAQLENVLQAVVTQQLVVKASNTGRTAAFEIMLANDAIRSLIRDNRAYQIQAVLQTGVQAGMMPMDYCLSRLVRDGRISQSEAFLHCMDAGSLRRYLSARAL